MNYRDLVERLSAIAAEDMAPKTVPPEENANQDDTSAGSPNNSNNPTAPTAQTPVAPSGAIPGAQPDIGHSSKIPPPPTITPQGAPTVAPQQNSNANDLKAQITAMQSALTALRTQAKPATPMTPQLQPTTSQSVQQQQANAIAQANLANAPKPGEPTKESLLSSVVDSLLNEAKPKAISPEQKAEWDKTIYKWHKALNDKDPARAASAKKAFDDLKDQQDFKDYYKNFSDWARVLTRDPAHLDSSQFGNAPPGFQENLYKVLQDEKPHYKDLVDAQREIWQARAAKKDEATLNALYEKKRNAWKAATDKDAEIANGGKPTTDKPTTDKPTTDKPTTDKPTTDKPTTDKPTTDKPTTDKPTTDKPTTDKPTTTEPRKYADHVTASYGMGSKDRPNEKVKQLQQQLKDAGYGDLLGNYGENGDGVDGVFRGATQKALAKFQADSKLKDQKGTAAGKETNPALATAVAKKKAEGGDGSGEVSTDGPAPATRSLTTPRKASPEVAAIAKDAGLDLDNDADLYIDDKGDVISKKYGLVAGKFGVHPQQLAARRTGAEDFTFDQNMTQMIDNKTGKPTHTWDVATKSFKPVGQASAPATTPSEEETTLQKQQRLDREKAEAKARTEKETAARADASREEQIQAFLKAHPGVTYNKDTSKFKDEKGNHLGSWNTSINPDTNQMYGIDISARKDFKTSVPGVYTGRPAEQPPKVSSQAEKPVAAADSSDGFGSWLKKTFTAEIPDGKGGKVTALNPLAIDINNPVQRQAATPENPTLASQAKAAREVPESFSYKLDLTPVVEDILNEGGATGVATANKDDRSAWQATKDVAGKAVNAVADAIPQPVKDVASKVGNNPVVQKVAKYAGPAGGAYGAYNSVVDFDEADEAEAKGDKVGAWLKRAKGTTAAAMLPTSVAAVIPATAPVAIPADIGLAIANGTLTAADWARDKWFPYQGSEQTTKEDLDRIMSLTKYKAGK